MSSIAWQFVACVLAADFVTGFVHWWEDTYGLPTWPVLGEHVIEPNIEHHRHPGLMGAMNRFWDRWWQGGLFALGVMAIAGLVGVLTWHLVAIAAVASLGNEVHTWSHRGQRSGIVGLLQDAALVQTPQQHAKHHRGEFDRYYCTITNITNAVLERLNFWRRLEAVVSLAGVDPKRGSEARSFL